MGIDFTKEQIDILQEAQEYILPIGRVQFEGFFKCDCCGYPTRQEETNHTICPLCDWVNGQDQQGESISWVDDEILTYTLAEAQSNFARYLVHRVPDDIPMFEFETKLEILKAKRDLIATFFKAVNSSGLTDELQFWAMIPGTLQKLINTKAVEEIFGAEADEMIFFGLPDLVSRKLASYPFESLNEAEKTILLVSEFEYQVSNGGFHQFLHYTDTITQTVAALKSIEALAHLAILERVLSQLFPTTTPPTETAERVKIIEKVTDGRLGWFEAIDDECYELNEELDLLLANYARKHKAEFL